MAKRIRRFTSSSTAEDVLKGIDLTGKTALITGTSSGIGLETAKSLALHGAHVIMANRNIPASQKLRGEILAAKPDAKVDILFIELSSLRSVKEAANKYIAKDWPLHILILNAGVALPLIKRTEDGLETTYGVNHVAHFYLTELLLPKLKQSAPSRVIVVSAFLHSVSMIDVSQPVKEKVKVLTTVAGIQEQSQFYASSKLCNMLFAFALHRKVHQNGVNVYVLHPGIVKTGLFRRLGSLGAVFDFIGTPFFKSLEQGAATTVYCAVDPELANVSGKYFGDCWDDEKRLQKSLARDETLQDALWRHTDEFLREFESGNT